MFYWYDLGVNLEGLIANESPESVGARDASLFWLPPQKEQFAHLKGDRILAEYGCEYESSADSGDLQRRELFLEIMHSLVGEVAGVLQVEANALKYTRFLKYTLKRLTCHHLERVLAAVRKNHHFTKTDEEHRDVLFIAFCGIRTKHEYTKRMSEFYKSKHPMVPPDEGNNYLASNWSEFYNAMMQSNSKAPEIALYAQQLVRFLIPSYIYSLGPIPNPSLWRFTFSSQDVEDLYHGHCKKHSVDKVQQELEIRKCVGFTVEHDDAGTVKTLQAKLAHSTHTLLWALYNNDRYLLRLLDWNHEILCSLLCVYPQYGDRKLFHCIHYLLEMRARAIAGRKCGCTNAPPWEQPQTGCSSGEHDFWHASLLKNAEGSRSDLEKQIQQEVRSWSDFDFLRVLWCHCNDRKRTISSELDGSFALSTHWESVVEGFEGVDERAALALGIDLSTSDVRRGRGYDRFVDVLTSSILNLILQVRLCHENVMKLDSKYWRYTRGNCHQSEISIPYGKKVIVVNEVRPKGLNNCRIADVGLNLVGWYSVDKPRAYIQELDHSDEQDHNNPQRRYFHLKQFLQEMSRQYGHFSLRGYVDDVAGTVHEVEINVRNTGTSPEESQFDDLTFTVRVDNEDVQRCSAAVFCRDVTYLRLGMQLNDVGIAIGPDDVIHESAACLGSALEGDKTLESKGTRTLTAMHRSRAMQLSPNMLARLERTHDGLMEYLRGTVGAQMPDLLCLFEVRSTIRVLGLTGREIANAKMILHEASYNVIDVPVDDLSFATSRDLIKALSTQAALSIIHLSILSPLPHDQLEALVKIARNSSVRFLVGMSKLNAPLFAMPGLCRTSTAPFADNLTYLDHTTRLGLLMAKVNKEILEGSDPQLKKLGIGRDVLLKQLGIEVGALQEWAKRQEKAFEECLSSLSSIDNRMRLAIIVTTRTNELTDERFKNLGSCPNQRQRIQDLLWKHPKMPIVVTVDSLELESIRFMDGPDDDTVVEPKIYRMNFVVSPSESYRTAAVLGCSQGMQTSETLPKSAKNLVELVNNSPAVKAQQRVIPTFQAFVTRIPLCEFLYQRTRVILYLYFVLLHIDGHPHKQFADVVRAVTDTCNNIFTATIWSCLQLDAEALAEPTPSFRSVSSATDAIAFDEIVSFQLREGQTVNPTVVASWIRQLPSSVALHEYLTHATSPMTAIAMEPHAVCNLLTSSAGQHDATLWALELCRRLSSEALATAFKIYPPAAPLLSVVKWIAFSTAADSSQCQSLTADDMMSLASEGVVVELPQESTGQLVLLRTLLAMDGGDFLARQQRVGDFLLKPSTVGGLCPEVLEKMLRLETPLGGLFVHAVMEAQSTASLAQAPIGQTMIAWTSDQDPPKLPEVVVKRFTVGAWAAFLVAVATKAKVPEERIKQLIEVLRQHIRRPSDTLLHRGVLSGVARHLVCMGGFPAAHLSALIYATCELSDDSMLSCILHGGDITPHIQTRTEPSIIPLDPLDNSPSAKAFSDKLSERLAEALAAFLTRNVEHQSDLCLTTFASACDFLALTTTSRGRECLAQAIVNRNIDSIDETKRKLVYAVLWMVQPQLPSFISASDTKIVLLLSQYLETPNRVQLNFARTIQDNIETSSYLACALIGWVEYVPTTMLCALSAIPGIWSNKQIEISPRKCCRILNPTQLQTVTTPPYVVAFAIRPLPSEIFEIEFRKGRTPFKECCENAYDVSSGASHRLIEANLMYLFTKFTRYSGKTSISSNDYIGVKMVVLWFTCMGADPSKLSESIDFEHPDLGKNFLKFLKMEPTSKLDKAPSVYPPCVVDVQWLREAPMANLMDFTTADGCSHTREVLTVPLPAHDALEDWSFYHNVSSNSAPLAILKGFAVINALRFVQAAKAAINNWNDVVVLANDVLQPCLALAKHQENDAKSFFEFLTDSVPPMLKGGLTMATLSAKHELFVEISILSSPQLPRGVRDEVARCYPLLKAAALRCDVPDYLELKMEESFGDLIMGCTTSVILPRKYFPSEHSSIAPKTEVEPLAAIFSSDWKEKKNNQELPWCDENEENDDGMGAHMMAELSRKQLSGRSINISLIMQLQGRDQETFLTLSITPGAECFLTDCEGNVDSEGNLEITSEVSDRRVLRVFKNHGEAWNFCKARNGPVSLIGRGFFLYRSRENAGRWRFYIGRNDVSINLLQGDAAVHPYHVWHIAAYHQALCLRLPDALTTLLYVICAAVYRHTESLNPTNPPQYNVTDDDYMWCVLDALVGAPDQQAVMKVAKPLLAYTRLLLEAAEGMRSSGQPPTDQGAKRESLVDFQRDEAESLAPQRVGVVYDAELDVLTKISGMLPSRRSESCTSELDEDNVGIDEDPLSFLEPPCSKKDPAWYVPQDVADITLDTTDLDVFKSDSCKTTLTRILLGDNNVRQDILRCVRQLASHSETDFARQLLADTPQKSRPSSRLKHINLALEPVAVNKNIWESLSVWLDQSCEYQAELEQMRVKTSTDEDLKEVRRKEVRDVRTTLLEEKNAARKKVKEITLGEGVGKRVANEVELCCRASYAPYTHQSAPEEWTLPSPHILWKDYDPDGFSVESGEAVAFVLDEFLCYRNPNEERGPASAALHGLDRATVEFTSLKDKKKSFTADVRVVGAHEGNAVIQCGFSDVPTRSGEHQITDPLAQWRIVGTSGRHVRLQLVSNERMLRYNKRDSVFELRPPSVIGDDQNFLMTLTPARAHGETEAERIQKQARGLFFRWIVLIIGSPLSPEWKTFFLHHVHVHSSVAAPPTNPLIAYCLAQLCPAPKLRQRLLAALTFKPTPFCKRRDRFFGVTVTAHHQDFQSADWAGIPDRVGPVRVGATDTEPEQYRSIVKHFSLYTTHVIVEKMPRLSDSLLKWCCEYTKRFPWRFIVFTQCEVLRNMPENRDRVVDLNDCVSDRPQPFVVTFDNAQQEKYRNAQSSDSTALIGATAVPLKSDRKLDWSREMSRFVSSTTSEYGRVVLLVSPPGAGKTVELRNLEFAMEQSSANTAGTSKSRFVNFDCSGDSLVHQALVTLLDNALIGVELGTDAVVLVADEYHMLSRTKKAELIRWAESKISDIKIVMIANRDDADDEILDERLRKAHTRSGGAPSIIWRARVTVSKMNEALRVVPMTAPATVQKAATFLSTIRTLISDDVVSLRMATDMKQSPYSNEKHPTPLEVSLRAKMQPENAWFVLQLLLKFDALYDSCASLDEAAIIAKYTECNDAVELLVFTAMLPSRLLWDQQGRCPQPCDEFLSFVEFVKASSGYTVHPLIRLTAFTLHTLKALRSRMTIDEGHLKRGNTGTQGMGANREKLATIDFNKILRILRSLELVDHPSFFPLILGCGYAASAEGDALPNRCDAFAHDHEPTMDGIYKALARHEALDWSSIKKHWSRHPVVDIECLLKMANPSVVAPEIVLSHLTPQNVMSLLQRELGRSQVKQQNNAAEGATKDLLRQLVLSHYPVGNIEKEGDFRSPYFWAVWCNTVCLPLSKDDWVNYISSHVPPKRASSDPSYERKMRRAFLLWVARYGSSTNTNATDNSPERTTVAARAIATIAEGSDLNDLDHSLLWHSEFIAPAAMIVQRTADDKIIDVIGVHRAFSIAGGGAHVRWPQPMKILAKIARRDTLLTVEEANELLRHVNVCDTTPPRIVGAVLQTTPSGNLSCKTQSQLLDLNIAIESEHLCPDAPDSLIERNVAVTLSLRKAQRIHSFAIRPQSRVGSLLQSFFATL